MGQGILNRGTKVHKSKTDIFKKTCIDIIEENEPAALFRFLNIISIQRSILD